MFNKTNKPGKPVNRIDSLIGVGTVIKGDIAFSGGLRIDGEICGNVTASTGSNGDHPGILVVSEQARIDGAVEVPHMVVNGTINGQVRCKEFLELQSHARITGDVEYLAVEMQLGAVIQGRLIHLGDNSARAVELKLASAN